MTRRRRQLRLVVPVVLLLIAILVVTISSEDGGSSSDPHAVNRTRSAVPSDRPGTVALTLRERRIGMLPALLQDAAAKGRDAKQRHGDDGRGNGGGDGLPGLHSQIGVSRSENERQKDAERDRFDGHLRRRLFHGN